MKKYRRQYHIRVKPTAPKAELAAAISEHFASIPVPGEEEAISGFLQAVQKNRQARLAEESELSAQEEQKFIENTSAASPVKGKSKKQVERVQASPAIKNASQSNAKKVSKRESKLTCPEREAVFIYSL